ncbi:MAG: glycoside hydrolase family 27 protein [Myxococcota bacterium]|jgi:alpha-galactosidase
MNSKKARTIVLCAVALPVALLFTAGCGGDGGKAAGCGDGVCSYGEFCANCPKDCDCTTLAATPPMGWNSWNRFHCDISESLVKEMTDAMVLNGMREAGYTYVNLDDCWQSGRDADGNIIADPERFPSGIAALADYVHSKGMKFGLYTCAGTLTCQKKPGSYGYEAQDARTYASWNVDYVKDDWCSTEGMEPLERYTAMHDGLAAVSRPMVLSICDWGIGGPWDWGPALGQLWRTTVDIWDNYFSMLGNFDINAGHAAAAGPGHWNDPDMLEVGNGGMTFEEYKTHFSLWAISAAPLISGNDLRTMTEDTRKILLNAEVIAVDQDPAGVQGVKVSESGAGLEVWSRPVTLKNARAVVLFNRNETVGEITVRWTDIGLLAGKASVRDLWKKKDLGTFTDSFKSGVARHGVVMLLVQQP